MLQCKDNHFIMLDGFTVTLSGFGLTKVLSSPDVHLRIISSQLVKPGFVHYKNTTSDYRRPNNKIEADIESKY